MLQPVSHSFVTTSLLGQGSPRNGHHHRRDTDQRASKGRGHGYCSRSGGAHCDPDPGPPVTPTNEGAASEGEPAGKWHHVGNCSVFGSSAEVVSSLWGLLGLLHTRTHTTHTCRHTTCMHACTHTPTHMYAHTSKCTHAHTPSYFRCLTWQGL